jgi:hypothetical protein
MGEPWLSPREKCGCMGKNAHTPLHKTENAATGFGKAGNASGFTKTNWKYSLILR